MDGRFFTSQNIPLGLSALLDNGVYLAPFVFLTGIGISDTLITRMAQVALKERRRLVIALRETPLDSITLENALKLSKSGAIIAPVSPGLYLEESSISDLADTFSDKLLSLVGLHKDNGWRNEEI